MENKIFKQHSYVTIKQHNAITEARYEMTALQKNILYLLLSQLRDDDVEKNKYELSIQELKKLRNVRVNREELLQSAKGLITSGLTLYDETQKRFITIGILASADYDIEKNKENLLVEFDKRLYPFLYNVKSRFTTFTLANALKLKSKYSKRIYEMLSQYKDTGIFKVSIKELKERFELINSKTGKEQYSEFGLFSKYVLEVAKKEINEQTDINFSYETKKTGKKITDLIFHIKYAPFDKLNKDSNNRVNQRSNVINDLENAMPKQSEEDAQEVDTKQKYKLPNLNPDELKAYTVLTIELRWLDKKTAYAIVKNIPHQKLFDHIHNIKVSVQKGKMGKQEIGKYFKSLLSLNPMQDKYKNQDIGKEKDVSKSIDKKDIIASKTSLAFLIWKKMVFELGISYSTADKIVNQVPYETLEDVINKISDSIDKEDIKNLDAYVINRLVEEFKLKLN